MEVVLREPRKPSMEWRQVLAVLRDLGCEVRLASGGEPLNVVVIDGPLVWCGDTAPLVYPPEGRLCAVLGEPRGGRGACEGTQGQRDWTALHDGPLLRNRSCGGGPMATSDPSSQACGLALITLQST